VELEVLAPPPRMIDHLGIPVVDIAASKAFYAQALAPLGIAPTMDMGEAVGFFNDPMTGTFWIGKQQGAKAPELHIAFTARSRGKVREFFDAAIAAGAEVLHEPRVWPEYHPNYYGGFVRDPDGNNVEAVCHFPE
jgi:catechol 2,3-dioxygenase-like lactoylglutathione lyase family enzyme